MDPRRTDAPALGHSGSMGCPPHPQVEHHHTLPYLEVPTETAPNWWSILAGTGMPRRNSVGFSENYVSDAAPPFCLDDDSNPSMSVEPVKSKNSLMPPQWCDASLRSPPIKRKLNPMPPDASPMDIPTPSDEFLTQFWSKHHGSSKLDTLIEGTAVTSHNNISVIVTQSDDDDSAKNGAFNHSAYFQSHAISHPVSTKLTESIHMEDFPVATRESLAELDVLKREILASDFGGSRDMATSTTPANKSAAQQALHNLAEHKESEPTHMEAYEKPPSKLVTYLFNHPLTQNWFFRNPDPQSDSESSASGAPPGDENRRKQTERRPNTDKIKGMNVWAPQNL